MAAPAILQKASFFTASRNMENHNALLVDGKYYYEGAIAGKTGHTEAARNTLVTAASREDMTLICVVLRSENDERFTDTRTLFDYGFDNFHSQSLYWMDKTTPAGNVILPKAVTADALSVSDSDENIQRTRTWSYSEHGHIGSNLCFYGKRKLHRSSV